MKNPIIALTIIGLLVFSLGIRGCEDDGEAPYIQIDTNSGSHNFYVEVADDVVEQTKGLMGRDYLPEDGGMLFIFDEERIQGFWMKNTLVPLDMIFIDSNLTIVDINKDAQSCKEGEACRVYHSKAPARYVLEINGGLSDKLNITSDSKIKIYL